MFRYEKIKIMLSFMVLLSSILCTVFPGYTAFAATVQKEGFSTPKFIGKDMLDLDANSIFKPESALAKRADILPAKDIDLKDVNNHWSKDMIKNLIRKGAVAGYEDKTFKPDNNINVDEFLKILVVALGNQIENGTDYWASTYIYKAKSLGLIKEKEFESYDRPITRGEIARIAVRALKNESFTTNMVQFTKMISDYAEVNNDIKEYVLKAFSKGIITGYEDMSFKAENNATRAESVTIILRIMSGTYRALPEKIQFLTMPSIFSDKMVMQRGKKINVWGKAKNGTYVTVTLANKSIKVASSPIDGSWIASFEPLEAGGPYEMVVQSIDEVKKFKDILIGEVWLCSGQSNMQTTAKTYSDMSVDIAQSRNSKIRFAVATPSNSSAYPLFDTRTPMQWNEFSPDNSGNVSATGFYFALHLYEALKIPVGIIVSAVGGTEIAPWINMKALNEIGYISPPTKTQLPSRLYNEMIAPLQPYTLAGFLWYQGENNVIEKDEDIYEKLTLSMVKDWRNGFKQQDLPFYYVELPGFKNDNYAYLRDAQLKTLSSLDNSGMAIVMDLEDRSRHPINKKLVGKRLSMVALAKTYGKNIPYSGPLYKGLEEKDGKIIITFSNTDGGLQLKGDKLTGFKIASDSGKYLDASAKIINSNQVEVWSDLIVEPKYVRYCFESNPEVMLYNGAGIPASPFRTDNFPRNDAMNSYKEFPLEITSGQSKDELSINVVKGSTGLVLPKPQNNEAAIQKLKFVSEDSTIIDINDLGVFTALTVGKTKIKMSAMQGNISVVKNIDVNIIDYGTGEDTTDKGYNFSKEILDFNKWIVDSKGTKTKLSNGISISTPSGDLGFCGYEARKFDNELISFDMKINSTDGWPSILLRNDELNTSYLEGNGYMLTFGKYTIDIQRYNKGLRTIIFGTVDGFTSQQGPGCPNTFYKYGEKMNVQVGAIKEEKGVRLIVNINGKNVINYLDYSKDRLDKPGYFNVYSRTGSIDLLVTN